MIITIDGPTASGKSSIARMLAEKLGYYYVNSGLLYRSLAYLLINNYGYTQDTVHDVNSSDVAACFDAQKFLYQYSSDHKERIFFDGKEITPYLKDSFIDKITSITSTNEYARHFVTILQRELSHGHDIVIDGRDVGSSVFPHADFKFFLTASIDVRSQRWLSDQKKRGNDFTLQQAVEKIIDRDKRDAERTVAPLVVPNDAIIIDNSELDLQQTFDMMLSHIQAT